MAVAETIDTRSLAQKIFPNVAVGAQLCNAIYRMLDGRDFLAWLLIFTFLSLDTIFFHMGFIAKIGIPRSKLPVASFASIVSWFGIILCSYLYVLITRNAPLYHTYPVLAFIGALFIYRVLCLGWVYAIHHGSEETKVPFHTLGIVTEQLINTLY